MLIHTCVISLTVLILPLSVGKLTKKKDMLTANHVICSINGDDLII